PQDVSAVACGADAVAEVFAANGLDVVRTGSRGATWAEPMVEMTDDAGTRTVWRNVTADDVPEVLKQGNVHPKCLGAVDTIDWLAGQHRVVFDRCGTNHPLALPPTVALESCLDVSPTALIDEIETSGLRGRGGAGFPAHIKWRTVRDTPAEQKYLVCNADEGDSGTFADRLLLEGDPFRLIEGMTIAAIATGATRGFVYLRSEYPDAERTFAAALKLAYEHGVLGDSVLGSAHTFDLELFVGAGAYICGEETSLLESLEGRRGEIRAKPPVPAIAGLFGQPTVVHNVISYAAVPGIMQGGGSTYAELGVAPSTGTMAFQLAGNVLRGGLIEVPFGITLAEIVEGYGGGTRSGRPLRTVQIGGPLGAYLGQEDLDTPLTYEAMANIGAGIGHGGIVVFDDTVDLAEQAHYAFEFCEVESCGKCTPCRLGSVRGKETMQTILDGRAGPRELTMIRDLCEVMETASLCQMGGMTPIPVLSAMERFPEDFKR
ncbi:MAG: formate dehydrogenase, partial [Gammaproteobacteria bacterium]|nr:formate dehydrogenase [Gammaproteobacteria bacterium]